MKYLRHIFNEIGYSVSDFLRRMCGGLSEDARLTVILSMLLVFTIGNLYFSISTIYNWGQKDGRESIPGVQHIDGLGIMGSNAGNGNDTTDTTGRMELIDSPVDIDSYLQGMDSIDSINSKFLISDEKRTGKSRG